RAVWRILLEGEDGFSSGYIDDDWTTPDLASVLDLGMRNETALTPQTKNWLLSFAFNRVGHALRANTRRGSRRNIAAHYDLGNDFFRPWLDAGMNYSSALYRGDETLERAQQRKLDRIAELLALRGGEKVLEIGCGWGALAERLLRSFGANVLGVTLSRQQLGYAEARLAAEIERGQAELRFLDYRDIEGRFDRIASIEMSEAVGARYWPVYFAKLRACLEIGGIAVIQAITVAEERFDAYRRRPDFIQRHIFPGGMLPTQSIIEREAARAGLKLVFHESFGDSYARTLREWRKRFLQAWPKLEALDFNARFRRLWEYYLAYCEIGFRSGSVDVGFYKLAG
ncbi:class I SAM-dependent methyltransferase, partial [Bradyrhizobium sp.]|uniref:class I SAM-dependent methyltransferase n=1 Tax=Bradyrhizobium sp. TaxID=376 RepID=UPI003C3BE55D